MQLRAALFAEIAAIAGRTILSAAVLVVAIASVRPAQAGLITYDFSYTLTGGDVFSGTLDGTLQADNNTVVISAITSAAFDGTSFPPLPYLNSFTASQGGVGDPLASLNGSVMDFIACNAPPA